MNQGQTIFAQVMEFVSHDEFRRCVQRYDGNRSVRRLSCWNQFLAMAFAQLTYRHSLRDIEVCLRAQRSKLYHCGFKSPIRRSTLADANERRDWRIYADFARTLIDIALCLRVFPWAIYKRAKGAIKLHTLMEVHSSIPVFIDITHAKVHDVHFLDVIVPEPGSFLVMDRAYIDFARLYALHQALAFFVVRAKQNFQFRRRSSQTVDRLTGLRSDQTVSLTGPLSRKLYPIPLRRVSYYSEQTDQSLVFLTNNFSIAPLTVAAIYRYRWQIELFFKWIKQHLRIKRFLGTSPNSVKSQIWIAVAVYVLIAIIKKKLGLQQNLYTILQVLSLTLFEKNSILSLFENSDDTEKILNPGNQLFLFQN